ncbi:SpoIID/LytB domain-containing protein [Paenibacillus chartarius]|uniref:SpoIID/LytB domain-containing protein n=1 Tax=Paenibacillus chartarius TaxID=747481 RepID=A0ABV6DIU5_9BACL
MLKRFFTLKHRKITAAAVTAAALFSMGGSGGYTYAAVPKLESIRVALILDGKAGAGIPYATLTGAQGLDIGVRTPQAVQTWVSAPAGARFSLDQYAVLVLETPDWTLARQTADKLPADPGQGAVIWSRSKQGKAVYQVAYGNYNDIGSATAARDKLTGSAQLAGVVKPGSPLPLIGPLHVAAGTFAAEAEALNRQAAAAQAGLDADIVLQADAAGKVSYSVWIGSAATPQALTALQQQAAKLLPGVPLQPAAPAAPYMLRRIEATTAANVTDTHYVIGGAEAKVWVQPKQAGGAVTFKERFERSYRGALELSLQGSALAVVNEVPIESYVGSVVGSEMGTGWPAEALKAQAVAARTYVLKQGLKYGIAHVSDTTVDQAYKGTATEAADVAAAAAATKGEVLADSAGTLIAPLYSSNAGGLTADPTEAWGNTSTYLKSTPSPDDGAAKNKAFWYRVSLEDGTIGYVRSDYLKDTGTKNGIGLAVYSATESGVNVRPAPTTDASSVPLGKLNAGDRVTVFGQAQESNAFAWQRGPLNAEALQRSLGEYGLSGKLESLEVSKRGPSGRALELKANGQPLKLPYPDAIRTALGGLPSTRFEIEETGRYTIVGANGTNRQLPDAGGAPLYAVSAGSSAAKPLGDTMVALQGDGSVRVLSAKPQFVFTGKGFGHGVGMSQWGARGYAELGYDYRKILQTYYSGVSILKDGS